MSNASSNSSDPFRAAVLVISDRVAAGTHTDRSGSEALRILRGWGFTTLPVEVVGDDQEAITERLVELIDGNRLDLVITSGGTGLAARDVTPEATRAVLQREVPGLAEMLRRETARATPLAVLSRGVAGVRGRCLVVNLPGSPSAVTECLQALRAVLPHALRLLRGENPNHAPWEPTLPPKARPPLRLEPHPEPPTPKDDSRQ